MPDSENATASDWPVLLPFEDVGQPSADINREQATTDVLTRADNLRTRAALLRQPVSDDEAMERLRQSLVR